MVSDLDHVDMVHGTFTMRFINHDLLYYYYVQKNYKCKRFYFIRCSHKCIEMHTESGIPECKVQ